MDLAPFFSSKLSKHLEEGYFLANQCYRGRFAPSPSGSLHLGNLRTALLSWLKARLSNGNWLLRIDDLDSHRSRNEFVQSIQNDLLWLGLKWDEPVIFQSRRRRLYSSVLSSLRLSGNLYPCRCSRKIRLGASFPGQRRFVYPGTCRNLSLGWGWEGGKLPSLRLRVNEQFINSVGDIVLRRADGFIAYHLATVVDELTLGINEVIRGNDLLLALPAQEVLMKTISKKEVTYRHAPLLCDKEGRKLSKRDGSYGLEYLKSQGMNSFKVIGWLAASLGLVEDGSELSALDLLADLKNKNGDIDSIMI